jgi:hypothetical protein
MVAYNTVEHTAADGTKYVFVTRGKSAPVTAEEIQAFLSTQKASEPVEAEEAAPEPVVLPWRFNVPDVRAKVFHADIKRGLEFCRNKYGASETEIRSEAQRLFPELNVNNLWAPKEKKDGQAGVAGKA